MASSFPFILYVQVRASAEAFAFSVRHEPEIRFAPAGALATRFCVYVPVCVPPLGLLLSVQLTVRVSPSDETDIFAVPTTLPSFLLVLSALWSSITFTLRVSL